MNYTASYAAKNDPSDNKLNFVLKGLMGGYPGSMAVLPYYIKLKEYRDIESRDIWEYTLNLTQAETDQMVRYLWEISGETFDYYFFTENCSYRLLGILDVLRPENPMLDDFHLHAIPVDTIRAALNHEFITRVHYRPSAVTKFQYQLDQLDLTQQDRVYQLVSEPELNLTVLESYPLTQQSAMLEVAFQYSRLIRYPERNAAERSLQLLHARNKITASAALRDVPQPAQRDDEGHLSGRFQIDSGQVDEQLFLGFSWRPAYHDLTDQTLGYPQGSELRFFDTTVRFYEEDGFKIEDFTLVGIQSLKARNRFFKPLSWRVALSGRRVYEGESRPWVPSAECLLGP
ncbi:MAG: DUF4105 domain-containing protein, partial [Gammaproteobacteria bacterium]